MDDHIKQMSPEEVERRIDDDELVIVDVREDEEVFQGMIEGARHIPLDQLPHTKDSLDKGKDYVFICRSGGRSNTAAAFMEEQGFRASNMEGGMKAWNGEIIF